MRYKATKTLQNPTTCCSFRMELLGFRFRDLDETWLIINSYIRIPIYNWVVLNQSQPITKGPLDPLVTAQINGPMHSIGPKTKWDPKRWWRCAASKHDSACRGVVPSFLTFLLATGHDGLRDRGFPCPKIQILKNFLGDIWYFRHRHGSKSAVGHLEILLWYLDSFLKWWYFGSCLKKLQQWILWSLIAVIPSFFSPLQGSGQWHKSYLISEAKTWVGGGLTWVFSWNSRFVLHFFSKENLKKNVGVTNLKINI